MKILDTNTEQRKKWWEIVRYQDEIDLFTCIARHPKYAWRSLEGITKSLGWDKEKIDRILKPFIQNRMIIAKQTKEGMSIAYWERVKEVLELKTSSPIASDDEKLNLLNKQIKLNNQTKAHPNKIKP